MENLIMFKALNGEEVIARLVDETETDYTVERARVLSMQQHPQQPGQVVIGMLPWFLGSPDGTVDVSKDHVFARLVTIPPQFAKDYMQQTSPIKLA